MSEVTQLYQHLSRTFYFPIFYLLLVLQVIHSSDIHASPPISELPETWSYHWGDIPYKEDWQFEKADWSFAGSLDNVSGRSGEPILWLKLDLPASEWRNPYIFINSIDLTAQVFEQGKLTFEQGHIDLQGNSDFAGWPWNLIPVNQTEKTTLYFRIYSNYPFIGLAGEILIGEKADLLQRVFNRGLTGAVFVGIVFIVGIIAMCLGLIKREKRGALSTGFLSLNLSLMMFAENELSQTVLFDALTWRYIAAFSYFLIPAFLAWVVYEWFKTKVSRLTIAILCISLAFPVGVIILSLFSDFTFINAYPIFDALFIVLMLGLLIECARKLKHEGLQEGLIAFGILAIFVSLVLDMLSAHEFISWIGKTGQWGLVLFTLSLLAIYLIKDKIQQDSLATLTSNLEQQVEARTLELKESKAKFEQLARIDFLTGLLNRRAFMEMANIEVVNAVRHQRPLSLILFDLDHFKNINDQYGHAVGDQVLKAVASTTLNICREGDLICRYGGEEFVVLLQETSPENAKLLAVRIKEAIEALELTSPDHEKIETTASFGFISYNGYQETSELNNPSNASDLLSLLLNKADSAMYKTKSTGRNDITECHLNES